MRSKKSVFYRNGWLYNILITGFYGKKNKNRRYQTVADNIEKNDYVFDIGCGPGTLIPYLKSKKYKGIDLNEDFVCELNSKGIDAEVADAFDYDNYPQGDNIVYTSVDMMHHFKPRDIEWLEFVREMDVKKLIICESSLISVRNRYIDWMIDKVSRIIDDDGYSDIEARLETPHYSNKDILGFGDVIKEGSRPCKIKYIEFGTEVVVVADFKK
jgi:SAM-dependent methyltransferase